MIYEYRLVDIAHGNGYPNGMAIDLWYGFIGYKKLVNYHNYMVTISSI